VELRGRGSAGRSPPEAVAFFVKLHIIFALKYNRQQYTGGHYHGRPPFINIGGHVTPVPQGIDALVHGAVAPLPGHNIRASSKIYNKSEFNKEVC